MASGCVSTPQMVNLGVKKVRSARKGQRLTATRSLLKPAHHMTLSPAVDLREMARFRIHSSVRLSGPDSLAALWVSNPCGNAVKRRWKFKRDWPVWIGPDHSVLVRSGVMKRSRHLQFIDSKSGGQPTAAKVIFTQDTLSCKATATAQRDILLNHANLVMWW